MAAAVSVLALAPLAAQAEVTAEEVVKNCYYKYAGDDQRSQMTIALKDVGGTPQVSEYLRLWKNYDGKKGLVDKVVLFTESPATSKGLAFMRWGYSFEESKQPEMWIYIPDLGKVRRLSPRDPTDKAWVIKDEDLRVRESMEDSLNYLGVKEEEGVSYYVVEFTPKEDPVYNKRVIWFEQAADWDACVQKRTDFYDKDDRMVKQQFIDWEKIGDAWTWKRVAIESVGNDAYIHYDMKNVEVNVGLDDGVFSKRIMKRGYRC